VAAEGPLLHRRRLGAELRRLRGERTLDEVADATLISSSKLSRLENGQGVPNQRDIRDLVAFYALDTAEADRLRRWAASGRRQAWWQEYSDALPGGLDVYLDHESGASTIRSYSAAVVPPLLQTSGYAKPLYRVIPPVKSDDESVGRLDELREQRQARLVDPAGPVRLTAILDEAVLHRPSGSNADMAAQLDHLVTVSRQRNVTLTVVPFSAGVHAGVEGQFTILQYADDIAHDIVAVESHRGERFLERHVDVLEYLRIFDAISAKALDPDESRQLIAAVRTEFVSPKDPE
jgi:transcriptional regulator with XRE-family HTH domain